MLMNAACDAFRVALPCLVPLMRQPVAHGCTYLASSLPGCDPQLCLLRARDTREQVFSHAPASERAELKKALLQIAQPLADGQGLRLAEAGDAPAQLAEASLLAAAPAEAAVAAVTSSARTANDDPAQPQPPLGDAQSLDGQGVDLDELLSLAAALAAEERARSGRLLSGLFRAADANGDGTLSIDEFAELVRRVSARVGERELLQMYAEAHALSAAERAATSGAPSAEHLPGIHAAAFVSVAHRHGLLLLGPPSGRALTDAGPAASVEEVAAVLLDEWEPLHAKIRKWPPRAAGKKELQHMAADMSGMVNRIADGPKPPPQQLLDDAWALYRRIATMVHRLEAELPTRAGIGATKGGAQLADSRDAVDDFLLSEDALADY